MPDNKMQGKTHTPKIGLRLGQIKNIRPQVTGLMKNLMRNQWIRVSPVFFLGTVVTAAGTTTLKNDTVIFIGMLIMGLGVVAMWMVETGKFSLTKVPGPLVFIAGTVLTSMSMTIAPSNPLLCAGMILSGFGTIVMWLVYVGRWEIKSLIVAAVFTAGVTIEAVSLTVYPSDVLIMVGMIATGIGAFGMWAFELTGDSEEGKPAEENKPVDDVNG